MKERHLPDWLKISLALPQQTKRTKEILHSFSLHTICESALCPNRNECFARGQATFMILGSRCTRNCRFCAVEKGFPTSIDENEPLHIAQAVEKLNLRYVVITSPSRDDLKDGGAKQFAETIKKIKRRNPQTEVEVLTPDFQGSLKAVEIVVKSNPIIYNHNLETVPRLYSKVRPEADFSCSLRLLKEVKRMNSAMLTKSGLMLGLGEEKEEVVEVLHQLRTVGCDIVTLGQYLSPSRSNHYPTQRYLLPEEFQEYKILGEKLGFRSIFAGSLVRSSYQADFFFKIDHEDTSKISE
ncbi:MAG: lipoyl synthase [Candidatus Edwardsbacteria bacterium]